MEHEDLARMRRKLQAELGLETKTQLTRTEASYLAGLLEHAEITITENLEPTVIICTPYEDVERLLGQFGKGAVKYRPPRRYRGKTRKQQFRWQWSKEMIKAFFPQATPYMQLQRTHAQIILNAIETTDKERLQRMKETFERINNPNYYSF